MIKIQNKYQSDFGHDRCFSDPVLRPHICDIMVYNLVQFFTIVQP